MESHRGCCPVSSSFRTESLLGHTGGITNVQLRFFFFTSLIRWNVSTGIEGHLKMYSSSGIQMEIIRCDRDQLSMINDLLMGGFYDNEREKEREKNAPPIS